MLKEVTYLVRKELMLEWRSKAAFGGVLLYVVSTIFVAYLSFKEVVEVPVWNALLWIILLFAATSAIARSFSEETKGKQLYMYTLASPQSIVISKIVYNALSVSVLSVLCYVIYSLLIGNLVQNQLMFFIALLLGAIGFSSTLTLISAIASQTDNNLTLMSILGFPIILPLLITLLTFSKNAIDGIAWSVNFKYIGVLLLLNLIVVTLSYLLFPYLWRD
ncbi:MAG: ABC transporter permease [Crocinitomicaceae bacterium]|nr:ABC transporter permease [Crocinitomicaceae bacterium]|tara:strand:- start:2610 stop:3266 length:657 start_codon:yes stop_codon:yes gene_type:complete